MSKNFGPNSANMVEMMGEDDCVERCKQKVMMLLGPDKAAEFDNII